MPEYRLTTKEIWYSYTNIEEADNIDDAIAQAKDGAGDVYENSYDSTIGYVSIHNEDTGEETDLLLGNPPLNEGNPNSIFTKSKKQEEVDKAIKILANKHFPQVDVERGLKILRGIKNI